MKKARKIRRGKKKKKGSRSRSREKDEPDSDSTRSSSSLGEELIGSSELFEAERRALQIWKRIPGALSCGVLQDMRQSLMTAEGFLSASSEGSLPPVASQYYRQHLQGQVGPVMGREMQHWCLVIDLMLRGRPAAALDVASQRIKSPEQIARGVQADIARRLELVGPEKVTLHGFNERGIRSGKGGLARGEDTVSKLPRKSVGVAGRQRVAQRRKGQRQGQRQERQRKGRRQERGRQGQRKRKRKEGRRQGEVMDACNEADGVDGVRADEKQTMEGRLCGRSFPPGEENSRGRPLLEEFEHAKSPRLEGGEGEAVEVSKDIAKEAARSSAQEAEDRGVPVSHTAVGEKQADLSSPDARRESEARSSQVSPSTMLQAMNAARVLLEQFEDGRMQTTALEDFIPPNECIFPLPMPPCRSEKSGEACEQMIFGLNHLAIGRGHGPVPARYPEGLMENLGSLCERFDVWDKVLDPIDFDSFFKKRGVTYAGEEIRLAQTLCWEAVRNSLPEQVGQLDLLDFCTEGTLHYIRHLDFLVPEDAMVRVRPPKVMVGDDWTVLSRGLVERGICEVWPVERLYHIGQEPLLNGLFAVGKGEFVGPLETQRLIMNLVPFNRGGGRNPPVHRFFHSFLLDEGEVAVMSAEDIRCFFYLFQVPVEWRRFLGFNKEVDETLIPSKWKGKRCVLVSKVLPMGFVNSVSIAQHIHRNVVKWSQQNIPHGLGGETEMRRDRVGSSSSVLFRVYLDNFDLLERHSQAQADLIKGTVAEAVEALREEYSRLGLPRHPKKATERVVKAEIQGAIVDGELGFAMPRPEKVLLYVSLALSLVQRKQCTLKELQVVCGGFVYFCMFRRPLLCALNEVWRFMERLKHLPPVVRMPMPKAGDEGASQVHIAMSSGTDEHEVASG